MKDKLIDATTQVVATYVSRNEVRMEDLPGLIERVGRSMLRVGEIDAAQTAPHAGTAAPAMASMLATDSGVRPVPLSLVNAISVHTGRTTQAPAVPVEDSIQDDYLVCLEDGKKLKMLKRHLKSFYNLTPDDYRRKWGLPEDYPMVCRNYAKLRSQLARDGGLGVGIQPKIAVGE